MKEKHNDFTLFGQGWRRKVRVAIVNIGDYPSGFGAGTGNLGFEGGAWGLPLKFLAPGQGHFGFRMYFTFLIPNLSLVHLASLCFPSTFATCEHQFSPDFPMFEGFKVDWPLTNT